MYTYFAEDMRKEHIIRALSGPLFGEWTREAIILRHNRELDYEGRKSLFNEGNELWKLMSALFARTPNISTVSLCTDWYEMPLNNVVRGLACMPSLRDLRFSMAGDITPLLGVVCKHIRMLPQLLHLTLQYSGSGSAYTSFVPTSELPNEGPNAKLEKLSLKIGESSPIALQYIAWLAGYRVDGQSKLTALSLDFSSGIYVERQCLEALQPCFDGLEALSIKTMGVNDDTLRLVLESCAHLKCLTLSVRRRTCIVDDCLTFALPTSLEDLTLNLAADGLEVEEWDSRLATFICDHLPSQLKSMSVRLACTRNMVGVVGDLVKSQTLAKERGIKAVFQTRHNVYL